MTDQSTSVPSRGFVDLVGAGPGDPGLLTRLGAECLEKADAVVYDHLIDLRLLDLAPRAQKIFAGKSSGKCAMKQEEINALLVDLARKGKRVVRLKGGDPYVFGRGAEEAEHLFAAGIPFRVVPGVTAAVGVTSYAGIPITHRDASSAVAFVSGHNDLVSSASRLDWASLARFPGTLVVYMGVGRLQVICETLIREGRDPKTPASMIQSGTFASQKTVVGTLATLPSLATAARVGPPALFVVGDVVNRRPALSWFENRPLFGRTIVVTRPEASASDLEALGAEVLFAPMIQILPLEDFGPLDDAIDRLAEFDWVVFTSKNGVRHLFQRLLANGKDLRALGCLKLAAIGPGTAHALAEYHLKPDLVPSSFVSEGLVDALKAEAIGKRVLLVRADRGRTVLQDELGAIAHVEHLASYRNVDCESLPKDLEARILDGRVDWITLTSRAITNRLHALLSIEARAKVGTSVKLASLSPVTTEAATALGWTIAAEAEEFTWDGLVQEILRAEAARDQRNSL